MYNQKHRQILPLYYWEAAIAQLDNRFQQNSLFVTTLILNIVKFLFNCCCFLTLHLTLFCPFSDNNMDKLAGPSMKDDKDRQEITHKDKMEKRANDVVNVSL